MEWLEQPNQMESAPPMLTPVVIERCSLVDWELDQIKKMSQEYASEYSQASNPSRECPKPIFLDEVSEDAALANADAMAEGFKALFGKVADQE